MIIVLYLSFVSILYISVTYPFAIPSILSRFSAPVVLALWQKRWEVTKERIKEDEKNDNFFLSFHQVIGSQTFLCALSCQSVRRSVGLLVGVS